MINPHIIGPMHCDPSTGKIMPFAVGQVDSSKGFVHVLDDTSLDIVLKMLDTITDFVNYLSKKEKLIDSGWLMFAAGEEDLLAFYLSKLNGNGEHDFVIPEGFTCLAVNEGLWDEFKESPDRLAQINADRVSYLWDQIIEKFGSHIMAGTWCDKLNLQVSDREKAIRLFAREPRTRRRMLSKLLLQLISKTPANIPLSRAVRVIAPLKAGEPYYVFLLFTGPDGVSYDEYRLARLNLLEILCMITKLEFPDAKDIVGLATEPGIDVGRSEDAIYFDARLWNDEHKVEAERYRNELGLLKELQRFSGTEREYPNLTEPSAKAP